MDKHSIVELFGALLLLSLWLIHLLIVFYEQLPDQNIHIRSAHLIPAQNKTKETMKMPFPAAGICLSWYFPQYCEKL